MSGVRGASVVFRADASLQIGTGHLMRCLALATALREQGATCRFVCRAHVGHLADVVRGHGFGITLLPRSPGDGARHTTTAHDDWLGESWPGDAEQTSATLAGERADWIVVDHYALEQGWESSLRGHAARMLVIDDLADRPHDCDLLLDQNLGRAPDDYAALVLAGCGLLVGPTFALLRPEFARLRMRSLSRRGTPVLRQLLITLGGVDAGNATCAVLGALRECELPADLHICVAMGAQAPALAAVRDLAGRMPWTTDVLVDVKDMATLMADSDLAIGAAGATAWERCCVGLPTLLFVLAANQVAGARALHTSGAALSLGDPSSIARTLPEAMRHCAQEGVLARLSAAAARVTDGGGVARVLDRMAACSG